MVVCTLHVISLNQGVTIPSFLLKLRGNNVVPVIKARVLRWMILPSVQSAGYLLGRNKQWDLLIGLGPDAAIPKSATADIDAIWTVSCGVSSSVLSGYQELNARLFEMAEAPMPLPRDTGGDSSQNLEISPELVSWISDLPPSLQDHPITMLNLLSFNPGKKPQYQRYGREFSSRVGSAFGGRVKIAARVVEGQAKDEGWDEIAFVHYPTLSHFAGMLGSSEYQSVNQEFRLGALKDTYILCVVEVDDNGNVDQKGARGKL